MIPGFGKQSITIGSSPQCDIQLSGAGVQPLHARVEREARGLRIVDQNTGTVAVDGAVLPSGGSAAFNFREQFTFASAALPLTHPALVLMLMSTGQLPATGGELVLGRDPARCHIALAHPNVSGRHATIQRSPLSVTDHGSTSGTWLNGQQLPTEAATALEPNALIAVGPVPVPVGLALQLMGAPPLAAGRPGGAKRHRTVLGQMSVSQATQTIGRTPDNDIQIDHAQVSSKHALLHRSDGKLFIEDRGSANGTYVRGQRIEPRQKVPVNAGERVFIGPMPLLLEGQADSNANVEVIVEDHEDWSGRPLYEIEAWDLVLQVPDRDNPKELKTLLDHVSFKAMPGDFIALMGPSGAGKTTLLLTLNGYLPPNGGQVRINGEDLYSIYDALRGSIGYVPQDDIVHPELTVYEAVRYSAKFRLPRDYSEEEIERRVNTTLQQLGLESVAHLQIGKPENKILSGGQRKRVNIAMELVTDPVIMFLDEPTSGLAADDTTALVSLLQGLAKSTGKTIITTIHQPAKDEFEKFNLCLIMGPGGIPIFYGPTAPDAYRFFGTQLERMGKPNDVDNPRDMFDMLNLRERELLGRTQGAPENRFAMRQQAARMWAAEFFEQQHPTFQKMYSGRRAVGSGGAPQALPSGRPKTSGQFGLLLSRYAKIKLRDKSGTWIMFLQAPIIGVLLALVFGGQKPAIPFWCLGALQELSKKSSEPIEGSSELLKNMQTTPDHAAALFFVVVSAVWFGTSNAAREIVSERAIYLRERMVNLGLFNYLFSKFLFLSFVCVVQCAVLLAIVFFALGFSGGPQAFLLDLATLVVTAMNSVALGLFLSTMVTSGEAAMALTPIALIPQVVLGGLMVPMTTNPLLQWPMYLMPARWGFQGMVAQERIAVMNKPAWIIDLKRPTLNSLDNFVDGGLFKCAKAQLASADFNGAWGFVNYHIQWLPWAVLGSMMFVTLVAIIVVLRKRDRI